MRKKNKNHPANRQLLTSKSINYIMSENRFATLDFYLAAFLMASSCKLSDYYREKGFTTFVFTEDKKLITLVKEYYSEKTLIEPITHARAIKNLKSLIHSATISTSKSQRTNNYGEQL